MKKSILLFGLFFAFSTFVTHAQITEVFSQDFELGTPANNYEVSSTTAAAPQTTIVSGGSRSMKMLHTQNEQIMMTLDTIDFSNNAQWNFYTLEFMHIAYVTPTATASAMNVCYIEAKRPGQSVWTTLNSTHYNMDEGGSTEFASLASFSKRAYIDWYASTSVNNQLWKKERFDLEQFFHNVDPTARQLIVRFVMVARNQATSNDGWFIDDITARASTQAIRTPRITMFSFPDNINYPSSRGAKIKLKATTTVVQGINGDSVFVEYRVGNNPTINRAYLHRTGSDNMFEGRIPFYGFDTLIHYHVVVRDSTVNNNTAYFPSNSSQWLTYRCVRGKTNYVGPAGTQTNNSVFPFPALGDNKSEFIYDSVTMAEMGYGPGYITDFRFIITAMGVLAPRERVHIRMANMPYSTVRTTNQSYTTTAMQIVYDSVFVIMPSAPNTYMNVHLQDTFFYSGSDLVVQMITDCNTDPPSTAIKHVPTPNTKQSLYSTISEAYNGTDPFTHEDFESGELTTTRPWIQYNATKHLPLMSDCGVSSLIYPSFNTPCNIGTDSVVVWLKNYGVYTLSEVRLWYRIDNQPPVFYDWSGELNAGDSVRVHLNDNQTFTVGYHTIRAWVDDTVTLYHDQSRVRDHEPYNDTVFSPFAACDGPYSGERSIGTGSSAHFTSLENCLYVLSRCGVNGPLTIKMPAGVYGITKFPYIPGTSETNLVTFEPATATGQVTFRRARQGVTTNAPVLVDMSEARGIRFNRINFNNGRFTDNRCDVLVQLGDNSANCVFENCYFSDSNTIIASAQALLHTGEGDSVLVTNCNFYGGTVGVDVRGTAPDIRSVHNTVQFCTFANQSNTAISIVNQDGVLVDSNDVNNVRTNASYTILGQYIYNGSRITRNKVYSTKGSSCIGVSDMHGNPQNYCVVANNMIVSVFDGTTNMLTTPLNIIKGSYMKVVFNSVRMNAPQFVNVAGATLGGDIISNSYFQNNVIAVFDTTNYAFNYMPGNNAANLHVDHNCYYSVSGVLNKMTGTNYHNINTWRTALPTDVGSVSGNPNYTNGSRVDLRSFNALLRNVGVPVDEVPIDMFGSVRNATAPSLGAYEVTALSIDFTPVEFVTPLEDYCGAPASIPVEVAIRNTGNGSYIASSSTNTPITVYYSINNGPVQSFTISRDCGPNDSIHFLSTRTMSLPSGPGNTDLTYSIKWWVKCSLDPDDLNDTSVYTVVSRYAAPAPTVINQNVPYNSVATVTPTAGINTWPVSYYTSGNGRQQRSGISWYYSMDDTASFFYGPTLTTTPLYADTTFYISQKRNLPLVKITEVQVNRTYPGATDPMPSWMNSTTAFAVELTNCGDYPANVEGDSIIVIQSNAAAKIWELPNVTIQPGENLLLQFKTSNVASDSSRTIYAPSTAVVTPPYTANFAVVYRDGHGVADAVPFNNVITAATTQPINWANQGVPAAIWQGSAINLAQGASTDVPPTNTPTAGARRIAWPTNSASSSPTATATLWQVATATNKMHIGTTENNLILYFDNGCEGARSAVNLHVTNTPVTDLAVDEPVVNEGCNLTTAEPVSVWVHNYGIQDVSTAVVKYSLDGGVTVACADTLASGLAAHTNVYHTFSNTINMHAGSDTTFNVKVWVDIVSTDPNRFNDTSVARFYSKFTPEPPVVTSPQSADYGERLLLTAGGLPNGVHAEWYSSNHTPFGITSGTFLTPYIYHPDTFYVKSIALRDVAETHVGTLASIMNNNYPSPYNPKTRYVKEQYLYTAAQIQAAGHGAGTISSLSFFLASLGNNVTTFTYSYYTIKMGTVTQDVFANGNFVTGLNQVYDASNLTFTSDDIGWVHHTLDTPFQWDGTSNIVIEITRALSTTGISAGANTRYTAQANTVITKQHATTDQASQTTGGSRGNNRPDILFGFLEPVGCESAEETILVNVTNVPDTDATIDWPSFLDTMSFSSCDSIDYSVSLTNRGYSNINNYTLRYSIDNGAWQQTSGSANNLPLGYSRNLPLFNLTLQPGRHTVTAVILVPGDTVYSNDTITRTFNVRFCGGEYVVGACSSSDYPSLTVAIDTLHNAGIAGPVVFYLCEQTFNEQLNINFVDGTNATNTITFTTVPTATGRALITYNPTNADNYVMRFNTTNYITFKNVDFYAGYTTGSGNNVYANVLKITGCSNLRFNNCTIRSKKTTASSTNANLVLLGDENRYITIDSCLLDSGYYAVRSSENMRSDNITVSNCDILNFWYQGVYLRNTDTVFVVRDSIAASSSLAGKPLTGVYIANGNHVHVHNNFIYLVDNKTGGKRGISINKCKGTNIDRVTVYNNMISLYGTGVASLSSSGIWIDSVSKHISVYFNTVSLNAGANQPATRAFSCQNSSAVHVLNNIFYNESKGYAYYVAIDTCITNSNFNVYYSNAEPHPTTGVRKYIYWASVDCANIDSLRLLNNKDQNSLEEFPYFAGVTNLRLTLAQFADKAQYNPDVTDDVFGNIRPQIPAPTIGAHEFTRLTHNITIAAIIDPVMPAITTGNNPEVFNIETDSITVRVLIYNNGNAPENNVTWHAYLGDVSPTVQSVTNTITRLPLRTLYEDSVKVPSPLGIIDTQYMVVTCSLGPGIIDDDPEDNIDTAAFFIYPAYDLQLVSVAVDSTVDPLHCRMYQVPLRYTVRNVGKKDIPADHQITLGYDYYCHQPSTQSFPNFPGSDNSDVQTFGAMFPVGTMLEFVNTAPHQPNLYPTGYIGDITVRLRGFVHHEYDIKPLTDTTNFINITSNHTPEMPIPHDTMVDYGTYGNLWATQNASRTIRWHRDTVSGNFFYNGNNNYLRSTHWSSTPQYFHDSLYYLSCLSTRNCTSYYSTINVSINPPIYYDVSISEVRSPRASGRVYLEKDTVTLRVVNYGSQPISNIPIAFKFMNANGRVTYLEVHDTVRTTIPGRVGDNVSYFDFSFDTALLDINQPLSNTTFTLNAWVYHPDDMQRGNDTLRTVHTFRSLAENIYDSINSMAPISVEGFDITRVSFNELDNIMPDMIGYDNLWLGNYNAGQAEVPTLFIRRGTTDTLTIEVANNYNEMDSSKAASLCVCIDYNRDGVYDFNGDENILKTALSKGVKIRSRREYKKALTIPDYAHYGYMRMLVWVLDDSTAYVDGNAASSHRDNGQMQQYLLYVQEDCMLDSIDAALTRVVSPRKHIVTDTDHFVSIMLANKGSEPLTAAQIDYSFDDHLHEPQSGTINWVGNLEPGMSEVVRLDSISFYEGTTDLTCTVTVEGDTFHTDNNTLLYQYHRYFVVRPRFIDSFDLATNMWYAPAGYNAYTRNYFERGIPAKSNIVSAYSQPNALVTSCTESVVTGRHGNRSVVYTPILDIRTIKCDTIHFLLSKNMAAGSYMVMEYKNYEGNWTVVDANNVRWGSEDTSSSWYDNRFGWTGNTLNGSYQSLSMATKPLSGEFPQDLQFRFVYTTPVTNSPAANFGDGVSIDNFKIGRAQRDIDVGVTEITYPTDPQFGQTIYPRVIIHNYGWDTISNFVVSYKPYGTYLAMETVCPLGISAGGDIEFEFPDPFVITNNFPDTFDICAFTNVQRDLYKDNDTVCNTYGLAPLANDLYMYHIVSPLNSAVAGDSINITVRLRNFGQNEIDECDVFYVYNNGDTIHEHVVFQELLGRNLYSTEFFNYTFWHRERATMGTMLLKTWCTYRLDVYPYNDTLSKQIAAISAITDIQATSAFIDERSQQEYYPAVVIDNVGARMVNDFKVGIYIDDDISTRMEETFHREGGLPYGAHVVYTFSDTIRRRSNAPYDLVTGYVYHEDDTNRTNDTTRVIPDKWVDLELLRFEVEENRTDSCRVRAVVRNVGVYAYFNNMRFEVTINGEFLRYVTAQRAYYIDPGETKHIDLLRRTGLDYWRIPKNPERKYVGSGQLINVWDDVDESNQQTNRIVVLNYFEGVPTADDDNFVLEQNYPNPYDGSTRIEFVLPYGGHARFFVNDVVGRQVYEHSATYGQGRQAIDFKKGNLPAGIYYYGIEFDGQRRMHKMIIK